MSKKDVVTYCTATVQTGKVKGTCGWPILDGKCPNAGNHK